ncbi:hypothetical protein ACC808_07700 [Rhizobium ruizarguesonis]
MNTCICPQPPGGTVRCPEDHIAICKIVVGGIEAICLAPSDDEEETYFRIIEAITGRRPLKLSDDDRKMLSTGSFRNAKDYAVFRMPVPRNDPEMAF